MVAGRHGTGAELKAYIYLWEGGSGPDVGFRNLAAHLQWHASSNKATPTKPSEVVPPNWRPGIQTDEPYSNHHTNQIVQSPRKD